ncbi:hypothetical protein CBR_g50425 [Chara braunii]|uniref:Uncharacterized protein n=1 Tax=Chara braunii TaxID=69332 RepID=A0A388M6M5_CHABU|nr:hypothetical protein CBR_g50425 [Chara braunii]|eukprot:GBG90247.1 hypothetical protein CBR_g50425 [Chara braunii]
MELNNLLNVVWSVIPFYVGILIGYLSVTRWGILTKGHYEGMNNLNSFFVLPAYGFLILATADMYKMNLHFVVADTVGKFALLLLLAFCIRFVFLSEYTFVKQFEWWVTTFQLATLMNCAIIGFPLLEAMYGPDAITLVAQIVVVQAVLWVPLTELVCELCYALRKAGEQRRVHTDGIVAVMPHGESVDQGNTVPAGHGEQHCHVIDVAASATEEQPPFDGVQLRERNNGLRGDDGTDRKPDHACWSVTQCQQVVSPADKPSPGAMKKEETCEGEEEEGKCNAAGALPVGAAAVSHGQSKENANMETTDVARSVDSQPTLGDNERKDDVSAVAYLQKEAELQSLALVQTQPRTQTQAGNVDEATNQHCSCYDHGKDSHLKVENNRNMSVSDPCSKDEPRGRAANHEGKDKSPVPVEAKDEECLVHNRCSKGEPLCRAGLEEKKDASTVTVEVKEGGECLVATQGSLSCNNISSPQLDSSEVWRVFKIGGKALLQGRLMWSAILGLAYGLLAVRFGFTMPTPLQKTVLMLSNMCLGLSMISLGIFIACQASLVPIGWWTTTWTFSLRLFWAPLVLGLFAYLFGCRGYVLKVAFMQERDQLAAEERLRRQREKEEEAARVKKEREDFENQMAQRLEGRLAPMYDAIMGKGVNKSVVVAADDEVSRLRHENEVMRAKYGITEPMPSTNLVDRLQKENNELRKFGEDLKARLEGGLAALKWEIRDLKEHHESVDRSALTKKIDDLRAEMEALRKKKNQRRQRIFGGMKHFAPERRRCDQIEVDMLKDRRAQAEAKRIEAEKEVSRLREQMGKLSTDPVEAATPRGVGTNLKDKMDEAVNSGLRSGRRQRFKMTPGRCPRDGSAKKANDRFAFLVEEKKRLEALKKSGLELLCREVGIKYKTIDSTVDELAEINADKAFGGCSGTREKVDEVTEQGKSTDAGSSGAEAEVVPVPSDSA